MDIDRFFQRLFWGRADDEAFQDRIEHIYKADLKTAKRIEEFDLDPFFGEDLLEIFYELREKYQPGGSCPDLALYNLVSKDLKKEYDELHSDLVISLYLTNDLPYTFT